MSLSQLKKEVDLLHKALNVNAKVPEWKKRSDEVTTLLKEYEQLSLEEKPRQNAEVLVWYKGEFKQP